MDNATRFPASVDQLHAMLQFVSGNALQAGFQSDQALRIELALEEAIVNIIEHGSSADLEILCYPIESGLEVRVIDSGMAFNPLMPLNGTSIGGYGIPLLTKIMDGLAYKYKDGKNIMTLTKFLSN